MYLIKSSKDGLSISCISAESSSNLVRMCANICSLVPVSSSECRFSRICFPTSTKVAIITCLKYKKTVHKGVLRGLFYYDDMIANILPVWKKMTTFFPKPFQLTLQLVQELFCYAPEMVAIVF